MHILCTVCNTTAFPKPNGIWHVLVSVIQQGEKSDNYNAEPCLQWTRVFAYERNQDNAYEWEKAKNDVDHFIFSRAMHHPTITRSAHSDAADTTHGWLTRRKVTRWTWKYCWGANEGLSSSICIVTRIARRVSYLLRTQTSRLQFGTTWGRNT